jgi:hypothetical protein
MPEMEPEIEEEISSDTLKNAEPTPVAEATTMLEPAFVAPPPEIAAPTPIRWQVILGGLLTTGLTLAMLYWLNANTSIHPMGWYIQLIIPAGAIMVGVAAASGYGIAAKALHTKIGGSLLIIVLILLFVAYLLSHYMKYLHGTAFLEERAGRPLSIDFFHYYDVMTRSMSYGGRYGTAGTRTPLGAWGYGIRLLEVIGFVGGGVMVPLVLSKSDYCDQCRLYMKSKSLMWIPAAVPTRKVNKKDPADVQAYEDEMQQVQATGMNVAEQVIVWGTEGDGDAFKQAMQQHTMSAGAAGSLAARIEVSISYCPKCHRGILKRTLQTGQGDSLKTKILDPIDLLPDFVKQIL